MAENKTYENIKNENPKTYEKLLKLKEEEQQLKNRIQEIVNKENEKIRKKRTRRLIQMGALSEKYLKCEGIEPKEFEKILQQLVKQIDVNKLKN